MAKTNSDPRCSRPDDCQAKGGALCRSCNLSSLRADPEVRARHAAAMADPEVRARITNARLSWCPPEFLDLYRVLVKKVGAKDARQLVEEEVAVNSRRTAAPGTAQRQAVTVSVPLNP